ncbi:MAG: hypothetical protein Q7K45_07420 [Nanoarchaeota archaeon]|nr:hypothetical protein [Nanoarchaeota archaeon]
MGQKYIEDIALAAQIGLEIKRRTIALFGSYSGLGKLVAQQFHLSESAAGALIGNICQGYFVRHISSDSSDGKFAPMYLHRLAVVYQLLGIESVDDVVNLTKCINSQFQYPLHLDMGEHCVVLSFSSPRLYLTEPQKHSLEMLALRYAQSNREKK